MGYLVVIGRELGSSQQVFKPLALLFGREGIKEFRRLFGPPKFSPSLTVCSLNLANLAACLSPTY